jgi:hypothetical protein
MIPAQYRQSEFKDYLSPGTTWADVVRAMREDEFYLDPTRMWLVGWPCLSLPSSRQGRPRPKKHGSTAPGHCRRPGTRDLSLCINFDCTRN